jgi:hypothetical protein
MGNTINVIDDNVGAVAGALTNVNIVGGAITNVNNVGNNISNVNTVASNISSVNSFFNTYRIGANNPTTSLDTGDLFFNTTSNSLKVYTGSAWVDGVTTTGNFALKTGNTFTGSNRYNDNVKAEFGTSADLEIYHDGSNSYIADTGTGALFIQGDTAVILEDPTGGNYFKGTKDAASFVYYDGAIKLTTTSAGITVADKTQIDGSSGSTELILKRTNTAGSNGNAFGSIKFNDSSNNAIGRISTIRSTATDDGDIRFEAKPTGGSLTEYLRITSTGNVDLPVDNQKIRLGAGTDFQLYHDGTHSYLQNSGGQGNLIAKTGVNAFVTNGAAVIFKTADNSDTIINGTAGAGVDLYFNATKRLETENYGAKVSGELEVAGGHLRGDSTNGLRLFSDSTATTGITLTTDDDLVPQTTNAQDLGTSSLRYRDIFVANDIHMLDNGKLLLGSNGDCQIIHDGTDTFIQNKVGDLKIANNVSGDVGGDIIIQPLNGEDSIKAIHDGAVELYFNGNKKLETTNTGADVTGRLTTDGVFIGDGGNNDTSLSIGASNDLRLYHDGSNSYILERGTGNLNIQSANTIEIEKDDGTDIARFHPDGAVELFYNGSNKFQTTSIGARIPDDQYLGLGDSDDLNIRFLNGTGAFIQSGGNNMYIRSNLIELGDNSGNKYIKCVDGAQVELYHGVNSKKLETSSGGGVLTGTWLPASDATGNFGSTSNRWGTVYATSFVGDGSNLTGITSVGGGTGVDFNDNVKARFGTSNDLEIYHAGNHSYIIDAGTGDLKLRGSEAVRIEDTSSGKPMITCNKNAGTEIYHQMGSAVATAEKKFETTSTGASITGNALPASNNAHDLGTSSTRWRNIYTNDLNLSNEGSSNDVDGTWGDWTIQEGESDLFLKNNRSGKKYKFNLMEVA